MALLVSVILITVSLLLYIYWSIKKAHKFFEDRKIPYIKPNFIFGNMINAILLRKPLAQVYLELYKDLAPHAFGGVFTMKKPSILIRDPDLLKNILIKDFAFFTDRGMNTVREVDPLSHSLFAMRGDEWKNLRIRLTSTFTSGKMKMMFPLLKNCGDRLLSIIEEIPDDNIFDAKDLFGRYTADTIGNCAFGLDMKALNDPNSEFRIMTNKMFRFSYKGLIRSLWPNIPKQLIKLFNIRFLAKDVQDYFIGVVDNTVKYREQNNVTRNDFLDLLIALKNNTTMKKFRDTDDDKDLQKYLDQIGNKYMESDVDMTNDLLAAQAFVFFTAGFEVTSVTLGYILLELALNQSIQDKVRQEILDVLSANDRQLTYETCKQMVYMDMAIDETLRKYPPISRLFRECRENYRIPNTEVIIPANTTIIVPVYGIHTDEKYYDKPHEFRPERFTEEEKAKRPKYTYLPFGDGPRVCIGERFAKLQVKVGLIHAIKNYSYRTSPKMKFPLEFRKSFSLLTPEHGILLQKQKI